MALAPTQQEVSRVADTEDARGEDPDSLERASQVADAPDAAAGHDFDGGGGGGDDDDDDDTCALLEPAALPREFDEVLESMGFGAQQWRLFGVCGLAFMADAMEIMLLSFLSEQVRVEWCLERSVASSIASAVFAGELLGCLVLGSLADRVGRKPVFLGCCALMSVCGFLSALASSVGVLIACRFGVGIGVGGLVVPFDLLAEFSPTSHRANALLGIEFFWTLGTIFVAAIAWLSLDALGWRFLAVMCTIPVTLSALTVAWLPESPRWLLSKGRDADAERVVRRAARLNGVALSDGLRLKLPADKVAESTDPRDLLSPRLRWTTLPIWTIWLCFGLCYYGIVLLEGRIFTVGEPCECAGAGGAGSGTASSGGGWNGTATTPAPANHTPPCTIEYDYGGILLSAVAEVFGLGIAVLMIDRQGAFARSESRVRVCVRVCVRACVHVRVCGSGVGGVVKRRAPTQRSWQWQMPVPLVVRLKGCPQPLHLLSAVSLSVSTCVAAGRKFTQTSLYAAGTARTRDIAPHRCRCPPLSLRGLSCPRDHPSDFRTHTDLPVPAPVLRVAAWQGALFSLVIGFVHADDEDGLRAIGFFARAAAMGSSCATWIITPEVYPTDIRATGHSVANGKDARARIGCCSPCLRPFNRAPPRPCPPTPHTYAHPACPELGAGLCSLCVCALHAASGLTT